jgi:large subunit ribosomal protein L5e
LLTKLKLNELYPGITNESEESKPAVAVTKKPRPFKAYLDLGLCRATTGARVFAALKGAVDGGLNIPHSETRFVGSNPKAKKFDARVLRSHIFGQHVAKYMKELAGADNAERYKLQFGKYTAEKIKADKIEEMYKNAHAQIRANPQFVATTKKKPVKGEKPEHKYQVKMTKFPLKLRQKRFQQKLEAIRKRQHKPEAAAFPLDS